jgi:hypothetical protein
MTTGVEKQFSDELTSFFVLILLNIAFGALVMAFGLHRSSSRPHWQWQEGKPPMCFR